MDWTNERYVRAYTRDTADYLVLGWQARGLWWEIIRKADRSGVIATNHGARGIAALVRWPIDVVQDALAELLADGCIQENEGGFVLPNYIEAQESTSSNAQRQRESRESRRLQMVTKRDTTVTNRDEKSRAVTDGHTESHDVTPSLAVPYLAEPNQRESVLAPPTPPLALVQPVTPKPRQKRSPKAVSCTDAERASIETILAKLSEHSGVTWSFCDTHAKLILARLRDGVTEWEMRIVVAYCASPRPAGGQGWKDDEKMAGYLRPSTLFGPEKIHEYLAPARAWYQNRVEVQQRRGATS